MNRTQGMALAIAGLSLSVLAAASNAQDLRSVTYLLPAPPALPAFAPWMVAQQRGYYAQEGLDVNFITAKGGADVAKQVGAGNAPLGGGVGDTPIIVRANGIPIKAVAVLGGSSFMHLAIDKEAGINSVEQLKGKTVGAMSYSDTTYFALLGMLKANGLNKDDVDIQASGPAVWKLFADRKIPALASIPEWSVNAELAGVKVDIIPADKYFKSMAQAILASDEIIQKDPELVRGFVRATVKGLTDIINDPASAAKDYIKAVPAYQGKEDYVGRVFKLYNELVYAGQKHPGEIDPDRLGALQDFYVKEGIVGKAIPLDELYTNAFIPRQ
ncbi:ABC transporter substrate-binding protein [Pusillimonas noertemannii]|uniref:NitT/TauT family transport system substrate-binding protein n=1 Tax=Pusillimonas noertemannii TaxID=305977 RepID=A0A2U1CRH6_9BURK|nr:ABC transporter substrate-binding protein [Pusillimonas noertemannii]NYT67827.1 ABC transporter substrate-binding protein [Pusillimonas noertemannii]PVY68498.1 NitT/TauT family transport system substrate-binding protein [Pusillimonas noertemannii]TFL12024.1 ABC transporter substrate-binding protein [Pusillimonas noertemannii]